MYVFTIIIDVDILLLSKLDDSSFYNFVQTSKNIKTFIMNNILLKRKWMIHCAHRAALKRILSQQGKYVSFYIYNTKNNTKGEVRINCMMEVNGMVDYLGKIITKAGYEFCISRIYKTSENQISYYF
jgi:hypothetical protein